MTNTRSLRYLSLTVLLICSTTISTYHDEYQWDEVNTRDKIDRTVNAILSSFWSWFDPLANIDIAAIKDLLYNKLLGDQDNYVYRVINGQTIKLYSDTKIPQGIRSGIYDYIGNRTYTYTFKRTSSSHHAAKAKEIVCNEIMGIMESKQNRPGVEPSLSQYLGSHLEYRINEILRRFDWDVSSNVRPVVAALPAPVPAQVTPDNRCYSGLDDPKTGKTCVRSIPLQGKVIIKPCGHSPLCVSCARQYIGHAVKACPQCQAVYDFSDLRSQVMILSQV